MEIRNLDTTDATLTEQAFALRQRVHAADCPDRPPPLWREFLARLRRHSPEMPTERLVALLDGQVVGNATVGLPAIDNQHLLQFNIEVAPAYRRRGIGHALLGRVRERACADQRPVLVTGATGPVPGGPPRDEAGVRFLAAMAFSRALDSKLRRIDLPAVDGAAEQRLRDECLPHAADYECLSWTGPIPEELLAGAAQLVNRLNTDAPTGDIAVQETTVDADRMRADERSTLDQETHLIGAAAVHRATGTVAAITRVDVRPVGDHGTIWVTIADPKHRGHRLGTIIKIDAHRLARRTFPELRYVYTGNADSNVHMVAINERLGYVAYETATMFQLTLERNGAAAAV
jgi:GNAT superfamily N-acetyltransferase